MSKDKLINVDKLYLNYVYEVKGKYAYFAYQVQAWKLNKPFTCLLQSFRYPKSKLKSMYSALLCVIWRAVDTIRHNFKISPTEPLPCELVVHVYYGDKESNDLLVTRLKKEFLDLFKQYNHIPNIRFITDLYNEDIYAFGDIVSTLNLMVPKDGQ